MWNRASCNEHRMLKTLLSCAAIHFSIAWARQHPTFSQLLLHTLQISNVKEGCMLNPVGGFLFNSKKKNMNFQCNLFAQTGCKLLFLSISSPYTQYQCSRTAAIAVCSSHGDESRSSLIGWEWSLSRTYMIFLLQWKVQVYSGAI